MFEVSRLILARKKRRYTQKQLATDIGITARYYNLIETGEQEPSKEIIEKLCVSLNFPIDFFMSNEVTPLTLNRASFRAVSKLTARDRDSALAAGTFSEMISDELEKRFNLPSPSIPDLRTYEPEEAAEKLRFEWKLGDLPISNFIHLLESKGVRIFSLTVESEDVDAFCFWKKHTPIILVNTTKTAERSRFDLAHELGHLVLHRHGDVQGREAEQQADEFASAFLMPKSSIFKKCSRTHSFEDLIIMKRYWGVSVAALNNRLFKLGLNSEWSNRQFCIEISKRGRKIEPNPMKHEFSLVLKKVSEILKSENRSLSSIADHLNIPKNDFRSLIRGLVISTVSSNDSTPNKPFPKPSLKLVHSKNSN